MSKNYEQLEIDTTLEIDRNLKDNVQTVIRFALSQMMEEDHPEKIRNRHEGYGIVAEKYSSLNLAKKNCRCRHEGYAEPSPKWRRRHPECERKSLQFCCRNCGGGN